jgi:hypothetical protein
MTALATALAPAPAVVPLPATAGEPSRPEPGRTLTLDDARQLVEQDDVGKWDFTVLRRDLRMKNGEIDFPLDVGGEEPLRERLAPTQYAFGQICARLGLPAHYLRRCPLPLRDQNVNWWLQEGSLARQERGMVPEGTPFAPLPDDFWEGAESRVTAPAQTQPSQPTPMDEERWLLRARNGTLRAALSSSYSALDNAALVEALLPALPDRYRVQWLGLEDESFHLRVIDPTKAKTVLPGDDFFVGVHIANSEIGARSVTVDALVYRVVCRNGLIALAKGKSLLRRRHVHIAAPRFKAALEEALAEAIGAVDGLLESLRRASLAPVREPEPAIDGFARLWQQSEQTAEIAKAALLTEPTGMQHSVYAIINAFTHAAQSLPDEKRYELELLAGQLAQEGDLVSVLDRAERAGRRQDGGAEIAGYAARVFGAEVVGRYPVRSGTGGAV